MRSRRFVRLGAVVAHSPGASRSRSPERGPPVRRPWCHSVISARPRARPSGPDGPRRGPRTTRSVAMPACVVPHGGRSRVSVVSPRRFRSSRPHPVPPGRLPPRSPAVSRAVVLALLTVICTVLGAGPAVAQPALPVPRPGDGAVPVPVPAVPVPAAPAPPVLAPALLHHRGAAPGSRAERRRAPRPARSRSPSGAPAPRRGRPRATAAGGDREARDAAGTTGSAWATPR